MVLSSLDIHGLIVLRTTLVFFVQIIRWLYISVFERLTCSSSFNHEVAGLNPS